MEIIKRLDFFRKPQQELQKKTITGACLSLLTILIALLLFVYCYVNPFWEQQGHLQVIVESSQEGNKFLINLDIIFYHAPCIATVLELKDKTTSQVINNGTDVQFQRIRNSGQKVVNDYIDPEIRMLYSVGGKSLMTLLTGLKNEEGCRITGSFTANRIPGILSIAHERMVNDMDEIKDAEPGLYSKLNLAHRIMSLTFGEIKVQKLFERKYGEAILDEIDPGKGTGLIYEIPQSCYYYLRIIPYTDKEISYSKRDENIYKYALHSTCFVFI